MISLLFWVVYLAIGLLLFTITMYALENNPETKNTLEADLIRMHKNRVMVIITIGWFPLLILNMINKKK